MKNIKYQQDISIENLHEHMSCKYSDRVEYPLIKIHRFEHHQTVCYTLRNNMLIFIIDGQLDYGLGQIRQQKVSKGEFIFIPQGVSVEITIDVNCELMAFRLLNRVSFCECYMIEKLYDEHRCLPECEVMGMQITPMPRISTPVWNFLVSLYYSISDGLICRNYFEIKIKELFVLLRAYHTKEQLFATFRSVASSNTAFSDSVRANYRNHKSAAQLAASMNLSHSGFTKKFVKIFQQSPYQWMMEQKADAIYADLAHGVKSFKQIASDYGFISPSHFNDFCKSKWEKTPGSIRKQTISK